MTGSRFEHVVAALAVGDDEDARRAADAVGHLAPVAHALVDVWMGDAARARELLVECASAVTADRDSLAYWRGVAVMVEANVGRAEGVALVDPVTGGDVLTAVIESVTSHGYPGLALYFAAEGALQSARLAEADQLVALSEVDAGRAVADGNPFRTVIRLLFVRLDLFCGRVTQAHNRLALAWASALTSRESLVLDAVTAVVLGNANSGRAVESIVDRLNASPVEPRDYISRGVHMLLAYALVALHEPAAAAECVLRAGGDAGLAGLPLIDKALGLEILVAAAVAADDTDAATAWESRALALEHEPITAPTISRLRSRVALRRGDADAAVRFARSALDACRAQGRGVELAETEIVLAAALIAADRPQGVVPMLNARVVLSEREGHTAVRAAAQRELRPLRRRLVPVSGAGIAGLSPRERDVAGWMAAGASNARIAEALFLSEHTVCTHVSRVLAVCGVPTRSAAVTVLLAQGIVAPEAVPTASVEDLTARQLHVARLIAAGRSNGEIAVELGISVKGVEKHVGEILRRWRVLSRSAIAARVLGSPDVYSTA